MYISGSKAPTGYRRRANGRLAIDPTTGPAITELFERRPEGAPISALGRLLEQRGVRTPYRNRHWCYTSTRGLLRNRVYLGEVRSGEFVKTGALGRQNAVSLVDGLGARRKQAGCHGATDPRV